MTEFDAYAWLNGFSVAERPLAAEPTDHYQPTRPGQNAVVIETFELASRIMDYSERLVKVNPVFADQILRSGTSVGSQVREAQGAESLADFLHEMKIGAKELEETDYRLDLCHLKGHYPHDPELVRRCKALFPLFSSILSTTRARLKERRK